MAGQTLRIAVLYLTLSVIPTAFAVDPSAATRAEVEHLLGYLERSGCEFFRNGSWHRAADARAHLERKYRYLLDRGQIAHAEDFIEHGATQSSMSGKRYEVKCGGEAPVVSAEWFTRELQRHRERKK